MNRGEPGRAWWAIGTPGVYAWGGSEETAQAIAQALVAARLAACVQIAGPISSVYHWQGAIETSTEWQCMIKSRQHLYPQIEATIQALHPYQVPEILAFPVISGSPAYLSWLDEALTSHDES